MLCYYCDEKFIPGHHCERPQLFMLKDTIALDYERDTGTKLELKDFRSTPEISFHAIAGANHPQTLLVLGKLGHKNITVMIDGGNTHNFIDQALIAKHGLPIV